MGMDPEVFILIIEGSFAERTAGTMAKSLQGLYYAAAWQEIISDCMDWPQSDDP